MNTVPTRTVSLGDLTPEELAQLFAPMGSDEQARFFNALACETWGWPGTGWCGQCAYIVRDGLNDEGANVVLTLAGHIELRRDSDGSPKGGDSVAGSVRSTTARAGTASPSTHLISPSHGGREE